MDILILKFISFLRFWTTEISRTHRKKKKKSNLHLFVHRLNVIKDKYFELKRIIIFLEIDYKVKTCYKGKLKKYIKSNSLYSS